MRSRVTGMLSLVFFRARLKNENADGGPFFSQTTERRRKEALQERERLGSGGVGGVDEREAEEQAEEGDGNVRTKSPRDHSPGSAAA